MQRIMITQVPEPQKLWRGGPGGLTQHPPGTEQGRAPVPAAQGRGQGEGLGLHPGTFSSWLLSVKSL